MIKKLKFYTLLIFVLLLTGCATSSRVSSLPMPPGNHIALLVPLTGPLSPYGNAIRNGFFAAYYDNKDHGGGNPIIDVLDTNGQSITALYQKAVAQGANFVVGPLDKNDVTTLSQSSLSTPVLALNTNNIATKNRSLVEFALSPTDDAAQVAIKAADDHHHAILILAPQSSFGSRMVSSFTTAWEKTGGVVVATEYYDDISTLSQHISDVLKISQGRNDAKTLEKVLQRDVRFEPQRRQDFDSIFIVADPAMAKQIMLLLHFYFVNTPIYATSQVYNGAPNPDADDLLFCEMPWIIAPNQMSGNLQAIQQHIQNLWPNDYTRLAKFYAMGVDAYDLIPQLSALSSNPGLQIPAATGMLSLSPDHQIIRTLPWAQFRNGVPVVL